MSGVDAAATLTLQIDTSAAGRALDELGERHQRLRNELAKDLTVGSKSIAAGMKDAEKSTDQFVQHAKQKLSELDAHASKSIKYRPFQGLRDNFKDEFVAIKASMAKETESLLANLAALKAKAAEPESAPAIRPGTASRLRSALVERADLEEARRRANVRNTIYSDEYAAEQRAAKNLLNLKARTREQLKLENDATIADGRAREKQITQEMVAQAAARELNVSGTRQAERAKELAREKQITQEMVAQAAARELNVSGTRQAERAKQLAIEKQISKEVEAQAKWIALTDKQRAYAAVQAAKAFYGGKEQSALPGVAGSSQALLTAQSSGSVAAAEAALAKLSSAHKALAPAIEKSSASQIHWNTVANEGHAAARGLAGGLNALWLTYGSLAPLLAGAALAGAMKQVFTVGKELEFQFTMISAISEGATVDIEKFGRAISGTMFTPVEGAQGLRVLAQAGLDVAEATQALPAVLKLATVGETDMANAALSATAIMHAFGLSVNDMTHIGDVFSKAAAISATSVTGMMEAMRQASSVSDMFGVSMEETAAALATLANRGIEGSAAGTAIRNMVKEMASPATEKAASAMKQFGIEVFNADGTSKSLTQNLQQLSEATATMTDKARTRFLEVLFNERGVKAANILLTDMQKMSDALDEIRMSSEGLGFMTEAQIKLSQSTEGMLRTLKSGLERSLTEVFTTVSPQVKEILLTLTSVVTSTDFKDFLKATTSAVISFTEAVIEHIDWIKVLAATYLSLKVLTIASAGFKALAVGVTEATLGIRALAAVDLAATSANMATMAANGQAASASLAAVAASGTRTTSVIANLGTGLSRLVTPLSVAVTGLGALVVAGYDWYKSLTGVTAEQDLASKSARDYATANELLARGVQAGTDALLEQEGSLIAQIRLLREGKTAAEAFALAKANEPVRQSQANLAAVKAQLDQAQARVARGPVGGGDATAESNEQRANINALKAAQEKYNDVLRSTEKIERDVAVAAGSAANVAALNAEQQQLASNKNLNEKIAGYKKLGEAAQAAINSGAYAEGVDPKSAERARARLQSDVDLMRKTEGLRAKPLSADASTAERQARQAQLDALLDNSYEPPKATRGGGRSSAPSGRSNRSDIRSTLNDDLSSNLKQEQIQLSSELVDIETELAGQTISSTMAIQKKNDATMASLEIERMIIQSSLDLANELKDETQVRKFSNDLDENSAKIKRQVQQATLDNTAIRTKEAVAISDMGLATQRYIEDLQTERLALDMTAEQVANLRIERERLRAEEDLRIRLSRNQVSPEQAAAEGAGIASRAEAQKREEEYQRSFVGSWKKAYKEWADNASTEYQRAADTFAAVSRGMNSALDEFVRTGKISFSNLARSIMTDIALIEARALMAKAMSMMGGLGGGGGGGGLGGIIGSLISGISGLFGGVGAGIGGNLAASLNGFEGMNHSAYAAVADLIDSAKGNVFSGSPSLHSYANTVQTKPQMFAAGNLHRFAKGGVFAEAGPEAVMPLARDRKGNLGVRTDGGSGAINITINVTTEGGAEGIRRAAGHLARQVSGAVSGARKYA